MTEKTINVTYTAEENGWLFADTHTNDNIYCEFYINGLYVGYTAAAGGHMVGITTIPINKGDTYFLKSNCAWSMIKWVPCKQ